MPLTRHHAGLLSRRYGVAIVLGLLFVSVLAGQQSQFQGSVPTGTASSTPLALTLRDAIERGLKTNLGLLVSASASEIARGQRLHALSALLPQVSGQVSETVEQLNLKTIGFDFSIPGAAIPSIVGPFQYTDLRASASITVFDYNKWKNYRSYQENQRAAQLSNQDARDVVVEAVANAYLQVTADASGAEAIS